MTRCRNRRVRAVRVSRRRSVVVSDISTWDYVRLKRELCSRPAIVLAHFQACQVGSLIELPLYLEILIEAPKVAARIALVAASMGILIGDEKANPDQALAEMTPGEV
jgi:hypothetical protein